MRQGIIVVLALILSTLSSVTPAQRPAETGQAANAARLILTEVLFAPANRDNAFVELANVGTAAADLTEFVLRVNDTIMPLPRLEHHYLPSEARILAAARRVLAFA